MQQKVIPDIAPMCSLTLLQQPMDSGDLQHNAGSPTPSNNHHQHQSLINHQNIMTEETNTSGGENTQSSFSHSLSENSSSNSSSSDEDEDDDGLIAADGMANPHNEPILPASPVSAVYSPIKSSASTSSSVSSGFSSPLDTSHNVPCSSLSALHLTTSTIPLGNDTLPPRLFKPAKISAPSSSTIGTDFTALNFPLIDKHCDMVSFPSSRTRHLSTKSLPVNSTSYSNHKNTDIEMNRASTFYSHSSTCRNKCSSSSYSDYIDINHHISTGEWPWVRDITLSRVLFLRHLPTSDFNSSRYYRKVLESLLSLVDSSPKLISRDTQSPDTLPSSNSKLYTPKKAKIKFLHLIHKLRLSQLAPHLPVKDTDQPSFLIIQDYVDIDIALPILQSYFADFYSSPDITWVYKAIDLNINLYLVQHLIRPIDFPMNGSRQCESDYHSLDMPKTPKSFKDVKGHSISHMRKQECQVLNENNLKSLCDWPLLSPLQK